MDIAVLGIDDCLALPFHDRFPNLDPGLCYASLRNKSNLELTILLDSISENHLGYAYGSCKSLFVPSAASAAASSDEAFSSFPEQHFQSSISKNDNQQTWM